jgi:hypothetical protein
MASTFLSKDDFSEFLEFVKFREMQNSARHRHLDESASRAAPRSILRDQTYDARNEGLLHSARSPLAQEPEVGEGVWVDAVPRGLRAKRGAGDSTNYAQASSQRARGRFTVDEALQPSPQRARGRFTLEEALQQNRQAAPFPFVGRASSGSRYADRRPSAPTEDAETVVVPWTALTPSMPGVHIRIIPNQCDCEDVAAALLTHWGIPASITVFRRIELVDLRGGPICDGHGRPVHRHRWRRVDYYEDGEARSVTLNAMSPFPQGGNVRIEYSYEEERELASAFLENLTAKRSIKSAATSAGEAIAEAEGAGVSQEEQRNGSAAGSAAASLSEDGMRAMPAADDASDASSQGESAAAPKRQPSAKKLPEMIAWGHADIVHDGIIYRPLGRNFCIVRMAKWYPHTKEVRKQIISGDRRVSLPTDPTVTERWNFFHCSLAHYNRDE